MHPPRAILTVVVASVLSTAGAVQLSAEREAHAQAPAAAAPAASAPPAAAPAPAQRDSDLTTGDWKDPGTPFQLHWHLLALPEYLVQLAFTPVAILVSTVERYRLDRRLVDLFEITDHITLTPKLKLALSEGFGMGFNLGFERIAGSELDVSGLTRLNGDYEMLIAFERVLAFAEGRKLAIEIGRELDQDLRYYGQGPTSVESDQRVLRLESFEALGRIDLSALGALAITGVLETGYRHERLSAGDDPLIPSVGEPGDTVLAPADFGRANDYGLLRAVLRVDTRDTAGRPTRGLLSELSASFSHELTGADFGSLAAEATTHWFFPLLPDRRVLIFAAGVRVSRPVFDEHQLPLFAESTLGRRSHLRGYNRYRFRDQHRWWTTLEYRFPLYEYLNTGVAVDAAFFVDLGRVGGSVEELFEAAPRISGGIGLRAGHETVNAFELHIGHSDEGPVFGFSLGKSL